MTEALDIVIIVLASGLGIGLGWLLAKMKFSTELVRAEVEAAMKELDEQRIMRVLVPVLDVASDSEEAEEDADAVLAPLGPTTKGSSRVVDSASLVEAVPHK